MVGAFAAHLNDGDDLRVGRVLYRIRYGSTGASGNALGVRPRIGALARLAPKPSSLAQVQPSAASGELTPPSWPAPVHARVGSSWSGLRTRSSS